MKKVRLFLFLFFYCGQLFAQISDSGMKPVIGISCSHPQNDYSSVRRSYTESVLNAGGLPILIPITESEEDLIRVLSLIDGLILIGGEDVHPGYYSEEPIAELGEVNDVRDFYDLALIRLATTYNLPVFGICRGEQLINVAFGGSLYQDISAQYGNKGVEHQQNEPSKYPTHYVTLLPGSIIAEVAGETELATNTHHHQAIKQVAPGFKVTAWACDSIPEAIESAEGLPVWGVQFHPESQARDGDAVMIRFFEHFNRQALLYRNKKEGRNPANN